MTDILKKRLAAYEEELAILQTQHDTMVNNFKAQVVQNQTRFAQISGAITELKELLKHEHEPETHTECGGNHSGDSGNDLADTRSHPSCGGGLVAGGV